METARPSLLVFVSVGDHAAAMWDRPDPGRDHHVCIAYYGNSDERAARLEASSDYFFRRKGGKFPNLCHWISNTKGVVEKYDHFFVTDDDLEFPPGMPSRLRARAAAGGYAVCSPAQSRAGRISWPHMIADPAGGVTLTNFVEMCCPLFGREALMRFLRAFSPHRDVLCGLGADYVISSACYEEGGPFAIFHDTVVRNPHERDKGLPGREIDALQSYPDRWRAWTSVSHHFPIRTAKHVRHWREVPLPAGSPPKALTLIPVAGLANRLRAIAAARRACRLGAMNGRVRWDWGGRATWEALFSPMEDLEVVADEGRGEPLTTRLFRDGGETFNQTLPLGASNHTILTTCHAFSSDTLPPFTDADLAAYAPKPSARMKAVVAAFVAERFGGAPVVGVHIRGTDNVQAARRSPLRLFEERIGSLLAAGSRVFLSTDDPETVAHIKTRFPGVVVFDKASDKPRWPKGAFCESELEEDYTDLLILSACDYVIGCHDSSYSTHAIVMNGDPRCERLSVPGESPAPESAEASRADTPGSPAPKLALTYSLFGTDPKYTRGMIANAVQAPTVYPGSTVVCHFGDDVPDDVLGRLAELNVVLIPGEEGVPGRAWRFFTADDPRFDRVLFRDADSRLSEREAAAVAEWIACDLPFHAMKDHPLHSATLMAGMWGAKTGRLHLTGLVRAHAWTDRFDADQQFLATAVWPAIRDGLLTHSWNPVGSQRPFPGARASDNGFVGEIFGPDEKPVTRHRDALKNQETRLRSSSSKHAIPKADDPERMTE